MADRVEVLDKVKALLLLPQLEMVTPQQIADFYEVDVEAVRSCYRRNKKEIDGDGTCKVTCRGLTERLGQVDPAVKTQYYQDFCLSANVTLRVPNNGLKLFSKRAVLRFGMLLRDSRVAVEVRTQLLNAVETAAPEQVVQAIDDEQALIFEMGRALASGDALEVAQAAANYIGFQKRHITALQEANESLDATNAMLAKQERTWEPRAVVNRLVRLYSSTVFGCDFRLGWSDFYHELMYRKGISLKSRDGKGGLLDRVREDEWRDVIAVAAALCREHNLDPSTAINETNTDLYLAGTPALC